MSTTSDFDRSAAAWMTDGPTELADRVLDAALREVHVTHQRRRRAAPWRTFKMPAFSSLLGRAATVVIVAALALGGVYLLGGANTSHPQPTPSASPAPSAEPTAASASATFDTSGWVDFTSARVGLSLKFPAGYAVTRATVPWIWRLHDPGPPEGSCDVAEAANHAAFTVCSERLPDSLTEAAWWDDYMQGPDSVPSTNPCFPAKRSDFAQVTVEGQIGYSHGGLPQCNFTEVLLVTGGRAYLFNATPNTQVITGTPVSPAILNAWLSTIQFDPASADDSPAASPASS